MFRGKERFTNLSVYTRSHTKFYPLTSTSFSSCMFSVAAQAAGSIDPPLVKVIYVPPSPF